MSAQPSDTRIITELSDFMCAHLTDAAIDPGTHRRVLEGPPAKPGTRQRAQVDFLKSTCIFTYTDTGSVASAQSRTTRDIIWPLY